VHGRHSIGQIILSSLINCTRYSRLRRSHLLAHIVDCENPYFSGGWLNTWTGRREHISPVLHELHWLPVRRHVDFKLATLMFKSLHGCAPSCLSDACTSAPEVSRRLRSSGAITCVIPWSRTRLSDRSFDVARPRLWNKLPASLRSSDSLCQFRRQLKTFLFVKDYAAAPSDSCF